MHVIEDNTCSLNGMMESTNRQLLHVYVLLYMLTAIYEIQEMYRVR